MKQLMRFFSKNNKKDKQEKVTLPLEREALEKKVVEGAEKAVKEYRRVFDRLAEYDRT